MKQSDLILIAAAAVAGVIILNAADNTVTTVSNDTGNLVAQVAPWGIAGIIAWGIFLA